MKSTKRIIFGLVVCFFGFSLVSGSNQAEQDQEMMEAYMKMMAMNENHAFLKNFVGSWKAETSAWMQPGGEPEVADNSAKAELIMGGRFLKVNIRGTMFGLPFEGLQLIGFDNFKKKIVSFWIDSTSTGFYLTEGTIDQSKNTINETGMWPDPTSGGNVKVRMVTRLVSKDEYTLTMFMTGPDGSEFKSMSTRSVRKK